MRTKRALASCQAILQMDCAYARKKATIGRKSLIDACLLVLSHLVSR